MYNIHVYCNAAYNRRMFFHVSLSTPTPPSTADVTELGDESEVGVVQALPILSSELVEEDFDSSLRFSLDPRLFDSSFSTCL